MEQKKIYPYLVDEKRMAGYYELLMEDKFKLKLFDKKKDKEVYDYFLPIVRDYMFWTFNMNLKDEISEYSEMENDLKAAVCNRYPCNIFEKGTDVIVCFDSGICFAITKNVEKLSDAFQYEEKMKMESIGLRAGKTYEFSDENIAHKYAYILQLYKLIYLKKINKEIQKESLFDKARNQFVKFTQEIYNVDDTDEDEYCDVIKAELKIEDTYIMVENQFDLLYRNNRLNENLNMKRFIVILLAILIIIGVINLGNWIG